MLRSRLCALATCLLLAASPASATIRRAPVVREPRDRDPLAPLLWRMDRYLQDREVDGVTMDGRYAVSPSEEIRQTVVCQVLGYVEYFRARPTARVREDIVQHADFLLGRLDEIRSHTPFDGMLGDALLAAYDVTREPRFLAAGELVTRELLEIPTSQCVLNGGLMVAMATAQYWRLTDDSGSRQKTHDIVVGLAPYQNADGSFPHWCWGSRDIHYTGWMAMELIHLQRLVDEPAIGPMLARMSAFLEGRVAPDGRSIYSEPCPGVPGCTLSYYSRASGCSIDYDTRGWTVEPAYCAALFAHTGSPRLATVMGFLLSLETDGFFADLYDYWPPPSDPEYPWTIADTSAVCSSINFWVLATMLTGRRDREVVDPPPGSLDVRPAAGGWELRFTLPDAGAGDVSVYDVAGRRVRTIASGVFAAGAHVARWDGRDAAGRAAPGGVYFVRLRAGRAAEAHRILVAR